MLQLFGDFQASPDGRPICIAPDDVNFSAYCDSMPTAIVVIFTPDGFVLGSDGMGNNSHGLIRLHEQKIIPTSKPLSWRLAYALSGAASLLDDATGKDIFKDHCQRIAEELKGTCLPDLGSYAEAFVNMLAEGMCGDFAAVVRGPS